MLLVWAPLASLSLAGQEHGRTIPLADYETLLPLHHTSRFGNVFLNTAKVIFEAHSHAARAIAVFLPD